MEETLIDTVAHATGLPKDLILAEIKEILFASGKSPQSMTLEDLREALVPLLQNLFTEVAEGENQYIKISG